MKVNQYVKVVMYLKQNIIMDHEGIVSNLQETFGKKTVMTVETSTVERVKQIGFRDAKHAVKLTRSKVCPKDLGGDL